MALYIYNVLQYQKGPWYAEISKEMIQYKPKHVELKYLDTPEQLQAVEATEKDVLLIMDSNSHQIGMILKIAGKIFGKRIIVRGNMQHQPAIYYAVNTICENYNSMDVILLYFQQWNKTKTALYGVNPNSYFDVYRAKLFKDQTNRTDNIFYNNQSAEALFQSFLPHIDRFDSVICTNDFVAVSLAMKLKAMGRQDIYLASYGHTKLAERCSPSITNTMLLREAKAIYNMYSAITKMPEISNMHVYIATIIEPRETTEFKPYTPVRAVENLDTDQHFMHQDSNMNFYNDAEISEMLRIENVLRSCDAIDEQILKDTLQGLSSQELANKLFMSLGSVKYRLKNLYQIANVSHKSDFVALIDKYIKE